MTDAAIHCRRILKRVVLWALAAILLLVWYVASPPIVGYFLAARVPALTPLLEIFYAPMEYYWSHHDLPGSVTYGEYVAWCHTLMQQVTD